MASLYQSVVAARSAARSPPVAFASFAKLGRSYIAPNCIANNRERKEINLSQGISSIINPSVRRSVGQLGGKSCNCLSITLPEDTQILGMEKKHGDFVNSFELYYGHPESASSYMSEAYGSLAGNRWDDGAYDTIRKIYVGEGVAGIHYIKFEYDKDGEAQTGQEHGKMTMLGIEEFELDYPNEYLISMEGYYDSINGHDTPVIQSIRFKTNKRTSRVFGYECGTYFSLEERRNKIIGFHGRSSHVLNAVGAYFERVPTGSTSSIKLEGYGGEEGQAWDDGDYDTVRKILVGLGKDGVHYIKFEYNDDGQLIIGEDHGQKTILAIEEFELNHLDEYLTSVEGHYDNISGFAEPVIQSLTFKTNKKTSQPFGFEAGTRFELGDKVRKIVGFHGRAGKVLHKMGVHVKPLDN